MKGDQSMKRKLFVILASLVMLLTFAPVAMAGTQNSCSSPNSQYFSLRLYENSIGDLSDGNDSLWVFCNATQNAAQSNLGNIAHTLAGSCAAPFKIGDNWNDCVSSFAVYVPNSLWWVCFYKDANYSNLMEGFPGPYYGSRYNTTSNDSLTSVRVTYLLGHC